MTKDRDDNKPNAKRSLPRVPRLTKDPEAGYGKPPPAHQFKPGQSGNPKGRPKGAKNESTILKELLQHKIAIRSPNGSLRKISVLEGIHRKIIEDALKGNTKSAGFVFNRYGALVSGELQQSELNDDDREILEAALARRMNPSNQGGTS
jgi:hypothetical protein